MKCITEPDNNLVINMSVLQSTLDMASGGQSIVDRMQAAIHTIDGSEMAKTVCKASTHEMGAPKKKHLDKLQDMTRQPNINQVSIRVYSVQPSGHCNSILIFKPELLNHIVLRTKEKSWIVVFKALVTCHHLLTHGHEKILQAAASRATLFFLENYNDSTSPQGYEMSPFVRRYAAYLNEKANAYRSVAFDFAKLKRGKDSIWNKYTIEKLNTQLLVFQKLIQKSIDLKPRAVTLNNPVINSAFALVHRDLIRLYQCYNDAIIVVIDKFMSLKHVQAKQSLEIFKQFIKHCDEINEFFKISQRVGLDNNGELPDFSEAPKKLLPTFEEYVRSGGSGEGSSAGSPVKSAISSPVNDISSALKQEEEALARFKANAVSRNKSVLYKERHSKDGRYHSPAATLRPKSLPDFDKPLEGSPSVELKPSLSKYSCVDLDTNPLFFSAFENFGSFIRQVFSKLKIGHFPLPGF